MPPTAEALAQAARDLEAQLLAVRQREILLYVGCLVAWGLAIGVVGAWAVAQSRGPEILGVVGFVSVVVVVAAVVSGARKTDELSAAGFSWALAMIGMIAALSGFAAAAAIGALALAAALIHRQHETWIKPAREAANLALEGLEIIAPQDCPQVLEWCKEHRQLAEYQSRVAEMPRFLVNGEVAAMSHWAHRERVRAFWQPRVDEQQAACAALKLPLVMAPAAG